jgi:hypothetical protein
VEKVFVRLTYLTFHKKETKLERVILDSMKDHLILHLLENNMENTYLMP